MADAVGPVFTGGFESFVIDDASGEQYTITYLPDRNNNQLRRPTVRTTGSITSPPRRTSQRRRTRWRLAPRRYASRVRPKKAGRRLLSQRYQHSRFVRDTKREQQKMEVLQ